jgi:archaemetzincin
MPPNVKICQHQVLQLNPSPFASLAGYTQPTAQRRAAAETLPGGPLKSTDARSNQCFPAPLVLPHDDLNYDPDCPPQSVNSWLREKSRNKMSPDDGRDTLYIGRVPAVGEEASFMRDWTVPALAIDKQEDRHVNVPGLDAGLFVDYLKAFYHGMNVTTLQEPLQWTTWGKTVNPRRQVNLPKYVGLQIGSQCTRVRKAPDDVFAAQLNLDDIIDAAIAALPDDAYALLLLVDYDIYESEDDDFCCGRAYGGSRVAVVQSARYNPLLDACEKIDRTHMWPFSHCKNFVDGLCEMEDMKPQIPTKQQIVASRNGPVKAAIDAATKTSATFTAGMREDVRQPPYLCPVCEAKVGHAIAGELQGGGGKEKQVWATERCEALGNYCKQLQDSAMNTAMWEGLAAWLAAR